MGLGFEFRPYGIVDLLNGGSSGQWTFGMVEHNRFGVVGWVIGKVSGLQKKPASVIPQLLFSLSNHTSSLS